MDSGKVSLFREFLLSGLTQKAFAEKKGVGYQWLGKLLWKQMMLLHKEGVITSYTYSCEVRYATKNKLKYLSAIDLYESRNKEDKR